MLYYSLMENVKQRINYVKVNCALPGLTKHDKKNVEPTFPNKNVTASILTLNKSAGETVTLCKQ